jgi:hypothetical protein
MNDTMKFPVHPWTERPNFRDATNVRANVNFSPNSQLDIAVNTGFTTIGQRIISSSNGTIGMGSQAFGGQGYPDNGFLAAPYLTPLHGYRAWTPFFIYQEDKEQGVNRFIVSTNVNWRPTSWLQTRADLGNDLTDRAEQDLALRNQVAPISVGTLQGYSVADRRDLRNLTANFSATATFNPRPWLNAKTTLGIQYVDYKEFGNNAEGDNLSPGSSTPGGGATPFASSSTTLQRTLGQFAEEAIAVNDRLFVTGAVRSDQNSAFGTNFQNVLYPKLGVSWVVSEERWFRAPAALHLDQVRVRYAYGKSGVQPGPNDALRTFSATSPNVRGTDQAGVVFNTIGNASLKPEQSTELETGFDARFFRGRATIDVTYYYKINKDALIAATVPPSLGGPTSQRANLGAVRNQGWEGTLTSQVVDKSWLAVDASLTASVNNNMLLDLGNNPPSLSASTVLKQGLPIRAFYVRRIKGWEDKNGDGILTSCFDPVAKQYCASNEVFVSDDSTYRGLSAPNQFIALNLGIDLLQRRLRISALADYRGGNKYYNNTERIRCVSRQNCVGLMDPSSTFEDQAMTVATLNDPSQTLDGFFMPGAFIKLRELSVQYTLPARLASALKARTANIVFSARNVTKWTKYRGVDPENDFTASGGGDNPSDFQTFGAPSYFIFRLNLGF